MKKIIRLTESDINRVVKNTIQELTHISKKRRINEGGDISFEDEDGVVQAPFAKPWRGVPNTKFIWHGEWADPEILYKGKLLKSDDVETMLYDIYEDDVNIDGYEGTYDEWIKKMGTSYLESVLDDVIYGMQNESKINKISKKIFENVKKQIREEYYPQEDDMMDDYYYGMMVKCQIDGTFDKENLSDEKKQELINTKDEYCDNRHQYTSVMIVNVDIQEDKFGEYDITIEAAVTAPEMPIDAIEEEVTDQIWYWFDNKTDLRATYVSIIEEKEVFDNRTEKYKH